MPKTTRRYVPPTKYSDADLDRLALLDLEVDLKCAEKYGHTEYAAFCRKQIERIKKNGERAHLVVLNG
jgi:hypothetical protein